MKSFGRIGGIMLAGCLCSTADASVPPPLPSGTSEGNEGSLFKNVQNGNTRYEFSGGAPGVDIFSSPSFGEFREDKKLLDRIIFAAPRYQKVGDEDCLRSRVIESTVIR